MQKLPPQNEWYWHVLPMGVAIRQYGWEKRRRVVGMNQVGMSQKTIAEREGISTAMVSKYLRSKEPSEAPVSKWFRETDDLRRILSRLAS